MDRENLSPYNACEYVLQQLTVNAENKLFSKFHENGSVTL